MNGKWHYFLRDNNTYLKIFKLECKAHSAQCKIKDQTSLDASPDKPMKPMAGSLLYAQNAGTTMDSVRSRKAPGKLADPHITQLGVNPSSS